METGSLPYQSPDITNILIVSSFLLLLNIVNKALDALIYCGLVGQILIGAAWGTPLAGWLAIETEHAVVQLGYLGLILLVYEGGLGTSTTLLLRDLVLSSCIALTGILVPISLSFLLGLLGEATSLQCFAAGAALSATSLGTTFTILSSSSLADTRLGIVLTSAAMIDDVVGLVLIKVVSSLGQGQGVISGKAIARPVGASLGFLAAVTLFCWAVLKPFHPQLLKLASRRPKFVQPPHVAFAVHTLVLIAFVTGGAYAGTSELFAAFLAGACVRWWDGMSTLSTTPPQDAHGPDTLLEVKRTAGVEIYGRYYRPVVEGILKPFFFASIGFAIPFTKMFIGPTIWRGLVYALLMTFGKLITGLWLVRIKITAPRALERFWMSKKRQGPKMATGGSNGKDAVPEQEQPCSENLTAVTAKETPAEAVGSISASGATAAVAPDQNGDTEPCERTTEPQPEPSAVSDGPKPRSLYPPAMLGMAMVSRGEIGFLIASLAQTKGIFSSPKASIAGFDLYLCVVWAILVCTLIGPLGVGTLVRRTKRLEQDRRTSGSGRVDVLGVWGVAG